MDVQKIREAVRAQLVKAHPLSPDQRRRAQATASLTEQTRRRGPYGVKHVYAGTVPWKVKKARRDANKRARVARRANR